MSRFSRSSMITVETVRRGFRDSLSHDRSSVELLTEQYRSLRPLVPTMYLALFINVVFLAGASARSLGPAAFDLPVAVAVLVAARLAFWWLNGPQTGVPPVAAMRQSMWVTVGVATFAAIGLSLWSAHILATGDMAARAYVALFTALCTIACAACLSSLPLAAYCVIVGGTVPVSVALLMTGDVVLMSMGANLLLVAPLVSGMIYRQHRQLRRMMASRSVLAARKAQFRMLAYRDPLTGLANRRAFLDALSTAIRGPRSTSVAVGMIDLDGFKVINDTYGHRVGDALLSEAARRFEPLAMGDAMIARLGGDEFAVLLRDVESVGDAQSRLALVAGVFDRAFAVDAHKFRLSASIGLAHNGDDIGTTLDLVARADLAMYDAKRRGPGLIGVFEAGLEMRTRRRLTIEQALAAQAIEAPISLVYQPVIDAGSNRIVCFEALARWTHPTLGVVSPAEFIPLAEQAGVTQPMTTNLLSKALGDASAWPPGIGLSFNISAAELGSPTLADRILDLVAEHGFDPCRLSIEVTETALLGDFAAARTALSALQRGGVRILLDDFGAGYASIGYLREIQFDGIKLDGSLIASLTDSPAAHDLLVGVLQLCRAIGAPVTAEMVETAAQYDLLRALGVEKMQGFYLSRPLDADAAQYACDGDRVRAAPRPSSVVLFPRRPVRVPGAA
ncbi:putative bifunctional diguanylate cyclase/phosphodiesterase [Glacieibacterium frigidum]|uniref:putative bifunctional diguanylate cyclase/phosphodiesterase n=1 Tax=Glacieibacterium frigidum TaxID=2593303 RepID=UPI00163DBD28|nr:EAL domain-containing protein [Glacieibacterium frigidum]